MQRHKPFRIGLGILLLAVFGKGFTQMEKEAPLLEIGEFPLTSQALGAFGTVPRWNLPKEIPNYYACFSLWVGTVDREGLAHVSSAEEGIVPEWRPIPLSWEERLDLKLPNAKTIARGIFTDLCEVEGHTPLGLQVTVHCG